jgi:hypothetical protein
MEDLMTSQTSGNTGWRRAMTGAVAGVAVAAGLLTGVGAPTAFALPSDTVTDPSTPDPNAPPPLTTDQVLAQIDAEYDTGAGGGQLSNLIHSIMKLKAQGYAPTNGNRDAIVAALDKRPNQEPLIEALQATLTTQKRNQARSQAATPPPSSVSIGQNQPGNLYDPNGNRNQDGGGITITPPSS